MITLWTTWNFRDCKYMQVDGLFPLHVVNISCILLSQIPAYTIANELFLKIQNPNRGGTWGHGISRSIEEIACGNSRGQLKKNWNFWGWPRKINLEFPGVLVFNTVLWNFQGWSFFWSGISGGKMSSTPPVRIFSGIAQWHLLWVMIQIVSGLEMSLAKQYFDDWLVSIKQQDRSFYRTEKNLKSILLKRDSNTSVFLWNSQDF